MQPRKRGVSERCRSRGRGGRGAGEAVLVTLEPYCHRHILYGRAGGRPGPRSRRTSSSGVDGPSQGFKYLIKQPRHCGVSTAITYTISAAGGRRPSKVEESLVFVEASSPAAVHARARRQPILRSTREPRLYSVVAFGSWEEGHRRCLWYHRHMVTQQYCMVCSIQFWPPETREPASLACDWSEYPIHQ